MRKRTMVLLGALVLSLALLVGCTGGSAVARGWAGATEIEGTLVFVTMTGRIYSVDAATAAVRGEPVKLEMPVSGGLISCGGQKLAPISVYASPVAGEDLVFIGGYDGKVYAFPLVEGRLRDQQRWTYPPTGNIGTSIIGGLTVANSKVYFASATGTVYALDASDGFKEWAYDTGARIWSAPAVVGDTVFVTSFDRKVHALNAATGEPKWVYETEGALSATPVVSDGLVYVGAYDRHMYALDAASGQPVWKFPAEGAVESPRNWFWAQPVIHGDTLYAPNLDGKVYALDARTGTLDKSYDVLSAVSSSPVVVGDRVIVAASDLAKKSSRVYAINAADRTFRELASFPNEGITAPLFAAGGTVYVHTTQDNFFGVDAQTGATKRFTLNATTSK